MSTIIDNNTIIKEAFAHRYPNFNSMSSNDKNGALKTTFKRNEIIRSRLNDKSFINLVTDSYTLDQFMNDLSQILIYSDLTKDIETAETYFGYNNRGLLSGGETIGSTTDRSPEMFVKKIVSINAI